MQTVWTQIRNQGHLILVYTFLDEASKTFQQTTQQTTIVVIGAFKRTATLKASDLKYKF